MIRSPRVPTTALALLALGCRLAASTPIDPLPGAPERGPELERRLALAWSQRPDGYAARTRHLQPDGTPRFANRLLLETSPYLLQHAHNPVDWYPWGEEAFERARSLGRPVLLSIGYSTCHWCHVMEEESFESLEIARLLNERYVAIKVDREERPDLDAIYMNAVQLLTGRGGWPMTVWLTHDRQPFHAGTYFPPHDGDRGVRFGFATLLSRVADAWSERPADVTETASRLGAAVRDALRPPEAAQDAELPGASAIDRAVTHYRERFDQRHGGVKGRQKFPSSLPIRLLLRHHRRTGSHESLEMATLTLEKMRTGGIRDQLGGGFHRYTTDPEWRVPHFERMLYDNALLALSFLEAYQATGRSELADVVRDVFRYVDRDMTSPEGAFYSASDADSMAPSGKREEGWFFTWTPEEVDALLPADAARAAIARFGIGTDAQLEGRSVLHLARPLDELARELDSPPEQLAATLADARERLRRHRSQRPPPLRDDKILASWNGLMIGALARAALVLDEPSYAERAGRAADFLLGPMRESGRLRRSFAAGRARHPAYLDDYAFLIAGLLDLYEATGAGRWIEAALELDGVLERHYRDHAGGGYFFTGDEHEQLLVRAKTAHDGAVPSGNAVQVMNLVRLHALTTEDRYRQRADAALRAFAPLLEQAPHSATDLMLAIDFRASDPRELVIVTPRTRGEAEPFLAALRKRFLPHLVLAVVSEGPELDALAERLPILAGKTARSGRATAYLCRQGVCAAPTGDPEPLVRQLGSP